MHVFIHPFFCSPDIPEFKRGGRYYTGSPARDDPQLSLLEYDVNLRVQRT